MVKRWEKVFFIAVTLCLVAVFIFRKELQSKFSKKNQQEQTIDAGDKVKEADKKNKRNKDDKEDNKKNDNDKKD